MFNFAVVVEKVSVDNVTLAVAFSVVFSVAFSVVDGFSVVVVVAFCVVNFKVVFVASLVVSWTSGTVNFKFSCFY